MNKEMGNETRARARRTVNACTACRQSKIRCSGEEPCSNCRRRNIKCKFSESGNKVLVSESYLRELQRASYALQQQQQQQQRSARLLSPASTDTQSEGNLRPNSCLNVRAGTAPTVDVSQYQPIDGALSVWTSPFTAPSVTIKNTHNNRRKWIWLAPSSVWSFTVRLTLMMSEKLQLMGPSSPSIYFDSNTYSLQWKPWPDELPPDISGLPSIDHAMYLFNTVKFHLGQHYRFYDETWFVRQMQDFYHTSSQEKAVECRLWFVQFLIVLAFGKAFLSKSRNHTEPPGAKYFVRAMALMPDLSSSWKDSLLAIEVLMLAGLYLYSIDQRESAHVYVGQAMRIAQLEGLHTRLPEEELGTDTLVQCRNLWWNLYNLDRHISISLGLPVSIADSDITAFTNIPCDVYKEDATLGLQAKLSHLLSTILSTIYRNEQTQLGVFLESTRSILHTMAGHAQELENIIQVSLPNLVETETMPRGTRHVTLLYHQCVIVATRPLLLSVLQERLEKLGRGDENWQSFLHLTTSLISTGLKSAVKTLQILFSEDSILEVFLLFDLEFAYGAALHLIMASAVFPGTDEHGYLQQTLALLDEMISKGNRVAEVRKAELVHLRALCQELAAQSERRGLETLTLAPPPESSEMGASSDTATTTCDPQQQQQHATATMSLPIPGAAAAVMPVDAPQDALHAIDPHLGGNSEFLDNIGISSYEFFSLADQLEHQEAPSIL